MVEDYGSFVIVAVHETALRAARSQNLDYSRLDTTIHLRQFSFDPLKDASLTESLAAATKGLSKEADASGDYYLVQFAAPATDEWLRQVANLGGEVIQYVPHQAFLVRASAESIARIAQHKRVRWVGPYQPVYKIEPGLLAQLTSTGPNARAALAPATYDIAIYKNVGLRRVVSTVANLQVNVRHTIELPNNYFDVLRVDLTADQLVEVAKLKEVIAIDPYGKPIPEYERSNQILAGNFTGNNLASLAAPGYNPLTQFGVEGANVTVSVVDDGVGIPGDGGFYVTTSNTVNGPLRGATAGAQGHGH